MDTSIHMNVHSRDSFQPVDICLGLITLDHTVICCSSHRPSIWTKMKGILAC